MDDPYIFDPESNNNGYDASLDIFAPESPKRRKYNHSNNSPIAGSSLAHEKQMDHIITHLHESRPSSLRLITSFPSSSITSPSISDSDSSSCLSITPSMIPEDCPCKCGSFRGSCLALTLPPSPLHFWVRGSEEEPAQHLFINDIQQFEYVQRLELENTLQVLNIRLDRLRETKSPPRSAQPWSEPELPPARLDVPDESGPNSERQASDLTFISDVGQTSRLEGSQKSWGPQVQPPFGAQIRRGITKDLCEKIPLRINRPHHYAHQPKATVSPTRSTSPINVPEFTPPSKQPSRTCKPSSLRDSRRLQRPRKASKTAKNTQTVPTQRTTCYIRPQLFSPRIPCGKTKKKIPRYECSSSPKRQRNSDDDNEDEEEEPYLKKRH